MPISDTRNMTQAITDAYFEALVGIFSLRLPEVKEIVLRAAPTVVVESSYHGQSLILDTAKILADAHLSGPQIQQSVTQLNRVFVAAMWDTLTMHSNYNAIATKPEIQLFRHIRNACAHGGSFNFKSLPHPAYWRERFLTVAHHNTRVFPDFIKDGDLILLFADIGQNYFEDAAMPGHVEYSSNP
jgi:hypothetical protein